MKNKKLENLIRDIYTIYTETDLKKNYSVFLYGQTYIHSMNIIEDIDHYINTTFVDSLLIQSKEEKFGIHGWNIDNYSIEDNCLAITFKNGETKKITYK